VKPDDRRQRRARDAQPRSDGVQQLDKTEIKGTNTDTEQRRQSTAAKIVIGREEIERFGDSTLDEVLKRLPSVSIVGRARRGGSIVMRGMGHGYTQLLINGERVPPGFALDQLMPDQVERIEIYRAPTAETGARAIAGTINIVLREALRISLNDVRVQLGTEADRAQTNVSWIRNDVIGDHGTYNVTLSMAQTDFMTQTHTRTTFTDTLTDAVDLLQDLQTEEVDRRDNLHFTSKIQWQIAPGEQLTIQPFMSLSKTQTQIQGALTQDIGTTPAPYAQSITTGDAHSAMGRVMVQFTDRLATNTRLELHATVGAFSSYTASLLDELGEADEHVLTQSSVTDISDRSWMLSGKLTQQLDSGHSLVGGLEAEGVQRIESVDTIQNGVPLLVAFGSNVNAQVLRTAAFVQDEWDPVPDWSANAGLRWESIETRSENALASDVNLSDVLTPLAHAVWRFDPPDRDQLRISLTRSYRAPTLQQLIGLPSVNTTYPVTESNVASSPDKVGNPTLRPELATGIDVAIEHYLPAGGIMSISAFARSIHDLMRSVTTLQNVVYSPFPRWVSMPVNFGDATTEGIEGDAKFRVDELVPGGMPLTLRANMSVYRSQVQDVIGPYNRIDQQPGILANAGFDYNVRSMPLTFGGNISWTPGFTVQSTDEQGTYTGTRRATDAYALWTLNRDVKLRFSMTNLLPKDYLTITSTRQGDQLQNVAASGRTTTLVAIRLEMHI
jgi:outer membrane receptor for ferrienterochelin and colicins